MYVATIVRDKRGKYYVRIATAPQTGGDVTVIDVLNGTDRSELERRAGRYVDDLRAKLPGA